MQPAQQQGGRPPASHVTDDQSYGYGEDKLGERWPTTGGGDQYGAKPGPGQGHTVDGQQSTRDCLDRLMTDVNHPLLVSKAFYFFFFAAFGSLFPLVAVYFKQIGMSATQVGLLLGFRPLIELASGPFWSGVVDRYSRAKEILLASLVCWVGFTLALAFVQPRADSCISHNTTHILLSPAWLDPSERWSKLGAMAGKTPAERLAIIKGGGSPQPEAVPGSDGIEYTTLDQVLPHPKITTFGKSPLPLDHEDIANRAHDQVVGLVSPPFSSVVYRSSDVTKAFVLIFLLMMVGEFFSSPALVLADSATLNILGTDVENYGRQRMMGSLGWAVSMFFVGIALDNSNMFRNHPCGHEQSVERNYTICFAIFSVLMALAFLAATQFRFSDRTYVEPQGTNFPLPNREEEVEAPQENKAVEITHKEHPTGEDAVTDTTASALADQEIKAGVSSRPSPFVPRAALDMLPPQWKEVCMALLTPGNSAVLFITWFMGFSVGLVFTFLFWHLQDLGGTPTVFGLASVVNHLSEIIAYLFSTKLIISIGHIRVLYLGLFGNVCRFMYISYLRDPMWVLPFEFVTGLTHATVWASCCSFITQSLPSKQRGTGQLVIQCLHHCLGRACGAFFGGVLVSAYGTEYVFRGYGILCLFILAGYVMLDYFYLRPLGVAGYSGDPKGSGMPGFTRGQSTEGGADEQTRRIIEETSHLAPCGVPMSLSRNVSSSRLDETMDAGYNQHYHSKPITHQRPDQQHEHANTAPPKPRDTKSYQNQQAPPSQQPPAHAPKPGGKQAKNPENYGYGDDNW